MRTTQKQYAKAISALGLERLLRLIGHCSADSQATVFASEIHGEESLQATEAGNWQGASKAVNAT